MSIPGPKEMPLTSFPSFLPLSMSPVGVAEVSYVAIQYCMCTGRFSRCSALIHLYILPPLCVCCYIDLRCPSGCWGPLEQGAEPRNCLAHPSVNCVFTGGGRGHRGHTRLSTSHLPLMIKDPMSAKADGYSGATKSPLKKIYSFSCTYRTAFGRSHCVSPRWKKSYTSSGGPTARFLLIIQHKSAVDL